MTYVKLFGSILDSTVWLEPAPTRLVWITMLAMADQHGCIWASVPGLAKRAGVERAECEAALACFCAPDPDSRTRDYDGRRIEAIDGGWELLNHRKFRDLLSVEDQKEKAAERQRKCRQKRPAVTLPVTPCHVSSQTVTPVTTSDTDTDTDTDQEELNIGELENPGPPTRAETARGLLAELNHARKETIAGSRTLSPTPENLKHIEARLEAGNTADDIRHVIAVAAAEVKAGSPGKWLNAVSPFRPENFARKVADTVDQRPPKAIHSRFGDHEPARPQPPVSDGTIRYHDEETCPTD